MPKKDTPGKQKPLGVQSATVGLRVLKVLIESRKPMYLRDIAAAADMAASNVYRYLVSFADAGMTLQDSATGRYDLGPLAIQLGLAALRRVDAIDVALQSLPKLTEAARTDAHLSIWGTAGPTVLRWRGGPDDVVVKVSEGLVLPLISSATGRVWCAFQSSELLKPLLDREIASAASKEGIAKDEIRNRLSKLVDDIVHSGVSFSRGERRAGIDALSAPVFDRDGKIVLTVTLLGTEGRIGSEPGSGPLKELRATTQEISRGIGAGQDLLSRFDAAAGPTKALGSST
ncbi:IclR family transcriptional regulator [Bradyrhizobium macuxiense]|uniref:IclR family transcriptional regulator n=1 Tax=Bradyrhizobium macuxiense TaxID=1755647 RepID=A0A560KXC3_9BRAD|nr:IclR family transcriptional regulator [Bradyrhizobium macuxiense]TWB87807.1 IclR family transcriptional regulator [Bradyrhizobium macuxiense]